MKNHYFILLLLLPFLSFAQTWITSGVTPDLSAYGEATNYPGEGEYQIFLSPDGILDKPIIVVDGFDTGDLRDINGIYSLLDFVNSSGTENLADQLRTQDFDVIILNFPIYTRAADSETIDGGTDFMERNAMLLVELITIINADKSLNSPDQNVIIGPSMGGLISRYALNYMEANSMDADTRLFISFDAPHLGANVPIGLQHQLNYLANNPLSPVAELQPFIESLLKSPAGRQLLIDHFESHLTGDDLFTFDDNLTLPEPHPFRTTFNTNINNLTISGFPENVRNVAIVNGSGTGSSYFAADGVTPVTNGFAIVDAILPVDSPLGTIDVEIDIHMTPAAGTPRQVSRFFAPLLPPFIPDIENTASAGTVNFDGVDSAPGGLFDLSALTDSFGTGGGIGDAFFAALQIDKFSYIPTVSALALDITEPDTGNEINWHYNGDFSSASPFANIYSPDANEPHVLLTEANVAFALDEILNTPLSISETELQSVKLEKNPVKNELILRSDLNSKATILISDLTGKIVQQSSQKLTGRDIISIDLTNGFYILNIINEVNTFTTRFIVSK
ncbi:T9SS type A sorting domain-containing protein [Winogradskyella costae]|uniref:T9SS type A sorting domain-containing protein n=1 Tax=Winogradskyella costae TaxID=2697008 RepID=UPI0015CC8E21|nr:T9SS type A sorting domain-containing protein [Winogradskyella costae]